MVSLKNNLYFTQKRCIPIFHKIALKSNIFLVIIKERFKNLYTKKKIVDLCLLRKESIEIISKIKEKFKKELQQIEYKKDNLC